MKAWTSTFAMRTGTGTQTVTGIVDKDGVAFTPSALLFWGHGTLDTLMVGDGAFRDAWMVSTGLDTGAGTRRGECGADASGFGYKIVDGGSSGDYSLVVIHAQLSFGGYIAVKAYVSAVASGEFTLTYDLNDALGAGVYPYLAAGQSILYTALGGTDLDVSVGTPTGSGLPTNIGFQAEGVLFKFQTLGSGTATGTGAGGAAMWGWATRTSNQGVSSTYNINQLTTERYQATDRCWGGALGNGTIGTAGAVTNWGATSFTVNTATGGAYLAAGGTDLEARAGTFTQPASPGTQVVTVGIAPYVVFVQSVGAASSALLRTDQLEWCAGAMDGTRGHSVWCGEIGNNPSAPLGGRKVSTTDVLQFATPNGVSTTFTNRAQFVSFDAVAGTFTVNWSAVDGTAREIQWFALGPATSPTPPTPTGTERLVRVVRRFPLPFSENKWIKISNFQVVMQSGVGLSTGQGSDPQAMVRFSKDGGHTWGHEQWVPMGQMGEYLRRARITRGPRGRNLICEVAVTDPVFVGFIQAIADLDEGAS